MFQFSILFLLGDLYLQTFSILPEKYILYIMLTASLLLWMVMRKYFSFIFLPLAFILGFSYTALYAFYQLSFTLPTELEGKPLIITGYIHSLPINQSSGTHFLFALKSFHANNKTYFPSTRIRLSSYKPLKLKVGDEWQFTVILKKMHGVQSPGAFDIEAWALENGIRATGTILPTSHNHLISHAMFYQPINQFRQVLQEKIIAHSPASNTSAWLMALIIGERGNISQANWQVLRNTGTNHLMAIAGLHIGIIASFMHVLANKLWRRSARLMLILPAPHAGAYAALTTALFYSALAGFSLPTQRACIMLAVFTFATLLRQTVSAWQVWSTALLIVLLLNPLSVLSESFWLSFSTIALIIYGMQGRLKPSGYWWRWGRVQFVIGLGLIPVTLALFQECSLISFIANTIAIPWLALLILPFCLLSAVCLLLVPSLGAILLFIADKSLSALWLILSEFSSWKIASWKQAIPTHGMLASTIIGVICLLFPRGMPGRMLGIVWLMPLMCYMPERPLPGNIWLSLLDVGQGLSVIIQTATHTLVYDAGPKLGLQMDMGESVVLPYLHLQAVKKIDKLVISHSDNDHIGGAFALLKNLPVTSIQTSTPHELPGTFAEYCLAGQYWQWDQVSFTFIYPTREKLLFDNDSSCVLLIDNGKQRILLPGDIEKYAEDYLVNYQANQLSADVLIAPHHGSKTSSTPNFISAIQPHIVLYATGYQNRYHFPHKSVVEIYKGIDATQLNTTETGTILMKFSTQNKEPKTECYRQSHLRYWMR